MCELLVELPTGKQKIIKLSVNGSYYDSGKVLWNTSVDGPFPEGMEVGKMQRVGDNLTTLSDYIVSHEAAVLAELKLIKLEEMEFEYATRAYANIVVNSIEWKADEQSTNLLGQILASGAISLPGKWYDKDDVGHTVIFSDLQNIATALRDRNWPYFETWMTKRNEINNSTDIELLKLITWDS